MTFNDVELAKIFDKIHNCFKQKLLQKMKSDGYFEDLKAQNLDEYDEYELADEINSDIYTWYYDIYTECVESVCYNNSKNIIKIISEDKVLYDDILETIEDNEADIPTDEKQLAYKLIDYGFVWSESSDSWADYTISELSYDIVEMIVA